MKSRFILCLSAILVLVSATFSPAQTLTEAFNAFSAHDIEKALNLFETVFANGANTKDRALAARAASVLHWRYYKQYEEGRKLLEQSRALGVELSENTLSLARLEADAGRYFEALDAAAQACLLAESPQEAINARISFARTIVDPYSEHAINNSSLIPDAVDGKLPLAHEILRTLVSGDPGDLASSRLLLISSILLGDGPAALEAWQSYYRIAEGVSAGTILDDANEKLSELLQDWNGKDSDVEHSIAFALALAESRMYEPATIIINTYIPADKRSKELVDIHNYGLFAYRLGEITDEYYRKTAIGEGDYPTYFTKILTMLRDTWEAGSWVDDPFPFNPPFTTENVMTQKESIPVLQTTLLDKLGAYITLGSTAGYPDLHYGHVVVDDQRTINQYGNVAEVRFLLLDNMVSNGFQSWAWDYRSQHGGWANETGIFQVRPAYTGGPMQTWREISDPNQLEKQEENIQRDLKEDLERAKTDEIMYLPGIRGQLRLIAQKNLYENLKAEGLKSSDLQSRFVAELTRITQDYSIFAHEGRHFIDKSNGVSGGEELEFRAKLSEIAFSEIPKLALCGGIFASNIGSKTPHGQANLRVMRGIVDWMLANAGEIAGLDTNSPMLLQLSLLTDDQLRAAVRSIDPLAQEASTPGSR